MIQQLHGLGSLVTFVILYQKFNFSFVSHALLFICAGVGHVPTRFTLPRRFELGVNCISLLWFLCEVVDGIISAKLMVSNLIVDMAVDLPSHLCLSLWCLSCNSFRFFFATWFFLRHNSFV